ARTAAGLAGPARPPGGRAGRGARRSSRRERAAAAPGVWPPCERRIPVKSPFQQVLLKPREGVMRYPTSGSLLSVALLVAFSWTGQAQRAPNPSRAQRTVSNFVTVT